MAEYQDDLARLLMPPQQQPVLTLRDIAKFMAPNTYEYFAGTQPAPSMTPNLAGKVPSAQPDIGMAAIEGAGFLPTPGAAALKLGMAGTAAAKGLGRLAGAAERATGKAAPEELARALTAAERRAPLADAPYPQYAERYPETGPGVPTPDPETGKMFLAKELTPEAKAFEKTRAAIIKDMKQKGYTPYFDPRERFYADAPSYPPNVDTLTIVPKKQATIDKDMATIGSEATRERLRQGYARGLMIPESGDWYAVGQLEQEAKKQLGARAGREGFKDFATSMSSTTGGANPESNLLMAQYVRYLRGHDLPYPVGAYEMPFPIGGRYATKNIEMDKRIFDEGGYRALGEGNPKRHDFAQAIMGNRNVAVMDEQMTGGMTPGLAMPPPGKYGLYARVAQEEAARAGVPPANLQDVAWAGFKDMKEGKPLISYINDAIERTHRLTGMPRDEIVRRGLAEGKIPIYGAAGLLGLQGLRQPGGGE